MFHVFLCLFLKTTLYMSFKEVKRNRIIIISLLRFQKKTAVEVFIIRVFLVCHFLVQQNRKLSEVYNTIFADFCAEIIPNLSEIDLREMHL